MINKISIKNIATFDDKGIEATDLKKINFFYGVNGSGKTTVSNFVHEPSNPKYNDCQIEWQNDTELKTLVYNKGFRERNFGKGTIPGVFTLGQATKEEIKAIEHKKEEQTKIKGEEVQKKETLEKQTEKRRQLKEEFKEKVWQSIYKKHEEYFKEAFRGAIGSKEAFKSELLRQYEQNDSNLKTIEELKENAKNILGERPEKISEIPVVDFNRISEIETDEIWEKKIIGKSDVGIAKFIQRLNINDWVNEGRKYLQQEDETCPFCQQETITANFRSQLEDYFDETFSDNIKKIQELTEGYVRLFENISNELQQIENNQKDTQTKLDLDKLSSPLKTFSSQGINNKELLNSKLKEPSREITLINTKEQLEAIGGLINAANQAIQQHNNIVDNYETERRKLINEIWKYLIHSNSTEIEDFLRKEKGLEKGIQNISQDVEKLRRDYQTLDTKIKNLTKNVTSVQPSVDAINDTLQSFGFENFRIAPHQTDNNHQYVIQRENGELAESTLSEGEITFITFLYFMQLAEGSTNEDNITEDRVLIVDDPVSSLDSNVLFIVSTLLKEVIKAIKKDTGSVKQMILLTHNVYFHKEVSFINGRIKECNDANC